MAGAGGNYFFCLLCFSSPLKREYTIFGLVGGMFSLRDVIRQISPQCRREGEIFAKILLHVSGALKQPSCGRAGVGNYRRLWRVCKLAHFHLEELVQHEVLIATLATRTDIPPHLFRRFLLK
jgi:hypothetical protein